MNTEQKELSTDVENQNNLDFSKNEKLIDQVEIEGTPFRWVMTDGGNFIALGVKRLTEIMDYEKAQRKADELKTIDWKFMLSVISVVVQETVAQLHIDMMKFNEEVEKGGAENE